MSQVRCAAAWLELNPAATAALGGTDRPTMSDRFGCDHCRWIVVICDGNKELILCVWDVPMLLSPTNNFENINIMHQSPSLFCCLFTVYSTSWSHLSQFLPPKNIAYSFNVALQSGYSSNSASQIREALRALEVSWTEWINTKSHLNGMVIINALLIGQMWQIPLWYLLTATHSLWSQIKTVVAAK